MTSGISAVMTLPCSSLPKNKPEHCPLLPFIRCIKTEYGKTVTAPQYEDLLRKLAETCTSFRILGSYATGPQLDRIGLDDVEDSHA